MLHKSARQELLSIAYFRAIVAKCGINFWKPCQDIGMDYSLEDAVYEGGRIVSLGHKLDVQLKSTCRAVVTDEAVRYRLDRRAFDNLSRTDVGTPRILVLCVLPRSEKDWVTADEERLCLRTAAYWMSLRGAKMTGSSSSTSQGEVPITLPRNQVFNVESLTEIMKLVADGKPLENPENDHE